MSCDVELEMCRWQRYQAVRREALAASGKARLNFGKDSCEQLRYHVRKVNMVLTLAANKFGIYSRFSFFAPSCEIT